MYDKPSNCSWSHRGDLSLSLGTSCRIFSTPKYVTSNPNPWDVPFLHKHSRTASAGSKEQTGDDDQSRNRGRSQSLVSPPTFGRGDEDGFPALNATLLKSALEAKRVQGNASDGTSLPPSLSRRSAAVTRAPSLRDLRTTAKTQVAAERTSRTGTPVPPTNADKLADLDLDLEKDTRFKRPSGANRSSQQSAYQKLRQVLQGDISTIMRWRASKGYGLSNVNSNSLSACVKIFTIHLQLGHNSVLASEDPALSEMWLWINCKRRVHGVTIQARSGHPRFQTDSRTLKIKVGCFRLRGSRSPRYLGRRNTNLYTPSTS